MNILIFPIRFLYKVYFFLYFALTLMLFYPIFKYLLSKKERFPAAFKVIKIYAKVWLYGSGIFMRVKGRENIITDQPFLICSNHSSFIDPATLYIIFDQYFVFTGKQEIEKWPLFHIFYTSGMNILVDRKNRMGALKSFKKMMDVIKDGSPLVILPEGTIPQNAPNLGEFKPGAVAIAIQMGIPILPITQTTNWKRLQRGTMFKGNASPGFADVIIHPIIPTTGLKKEDAEDLSAKLRAVINKPLQDKYGIE